MQFIMFTGFYLKLIYIFFILMCKRCDIYYLFD